MVNSVHPCNAFLTASELITYNEWLAFTHSYTHSYTQSYTDGGVKGYGEAFSSRTAPHLNDNSGILNIELPFWFV